MKKANATSTEGHIGVAVSRFGHDPIALSLAVGTTVDEALEEANIELEGREEVFVAGTKARGNDVLEDKDVLSIVSPKQAGAILTAFFKA